MATKTYEDVWASADDAYKARFGGDKKKAIKAMGDWNAKQSASKEVKEIAPAETQMGSHGADMDAQGGTTYTGVNPIHGGTNTRQNEDMLQMKANTDASAMRTSGTGNTYKATLIQANRPGIVGGTSSWRPSSSDVDATGKTPVFSENVDKGQFLKPLSTDTPKHETTHENFDSSTDEGIKNRFKGAGSRARTAKQEKKRVAKRDGPQTRAERKSARIHERSEKSWEKTKKKLDL